MNHLTYNVDLFQFTSAIAVSTLGFYCYYYLSDSTLVKTVLKTEKGKPLCVLYERLLGFLIFGCLPLAIIFISGKTNLSYFGIVPPKMESYLWILLLSILIVPMNYYYSRTQGNLKIYPQIREREWSVAILVQSGLGWILYLISYEFLFRGFLLFASLPILGLPLSIVLNTIIYALVHLPKGYKEMVGSVPLGILLCYLTYLTGSIWVAVFSHIVLALSSEWFSLQAHPQMVVKKNWL